MKNLIKELKKETEKRIKDNLSWFYEDLKENGNDKITEVEKRILNRKTPYKKSRVFQVEKRINEIYKKQLTENLENLETINKAENKLNSDLVLTINFYKSNTWGWCPKGNDNFGNKTSSITGCGYCKESTATAQLLNQNETILKRLFAAKNKGLKIPYGASSYSILPKFEGGVGINSHVSILEFLGFKVTISGNDNTTVLIVSEK